MTTHKPFPKPTDDYPIVYLKETDAALPSSVINRNNTRYAFFKTLAQGGKCTIQSCKDLHLRRVVCHKSLRKEIADDPYEQRRFLREARVSAMLQHPNTIPTYELGRDREGHYYFTMKLVRGSTLAEILAEANRRGSHERPEHAIERLVSIVIQVANALAYAHSHGVVHRDIKPANVLIGPFGEVLLLDWGLAKVWGDEDEEIPEMERAEFEDPGLTAQGKLQGTAHYMSPEQIAESEDIDHRTDLYSLGSVFYEALALEPMAWGNSVDEVLHHTTHDTPLPPRERSPHLFIPVELEQVCLELIEKDPDDRIQTATELVERLRSWRTSAGRVEADP